jgi:hypothetical protein
MGNPIVNVRSSWDLTPGPKDTNWKFSADANPMLKVVYDEVASMITEASKKEGLSERDKNALQALLKQDIAIGHGPDNWKAPFANDKQGWIAFPQKDGHLVGCVQNAYHELIHTMHGNQLLLPENNERPFLKKFTADWASQGKDVASNLDKVMTADWVELNDKQRQIYGNYDHDFEYMAMVKENALAKIVLGKEADQKATYMDNPGPNLLEHVLEERIHKRLEQQSSQNENIATPINSKMQQTASIEDRNKDALNQELSKMQPEHGQYVANIVNARIYEMENALTESSRSV